MAKKRTAKPSTQLPNQVTVLGHVYSIEYHDEVLAGSASGYCDNEGRTLHILQDESWRATLLHEMLHAILFISGHSFTFSPGTEEALVRALEHGLGPIYARN